MPPLASTASSSIQVLRAAERPIEVQDLRGAITNMAMTNIRTAIGAFDLDETFSKRDEINDRLLHVLDAATQPWGTKMTRVELKDISPPENVVASMSMQLTAEREKRASILQAEGVKQAAILRAEGDKQSQILAAEGRLAAANRDAEARERLASAEAAATTSVSKAVRDGNVQALNYFVAQKYVDGADPARPFPEHENGADADRDDQYSGFIGGHCRIVEQSGATLMQFSDSLLAWGWAVLALIVALLELHAPGSYLIWIALAAAVTAVANFLFTLSVSAQLAIFSVSVIVSCVAGYYVYRLTGRGPFSGQLLN